MHIVSIVSSVSARKLKCPSSARNLHTSARAEKFQLELITKDNLFSLFQELDKEFGDDPEETEIPDFDTDRFSTKSPELQTRTPSPDDPDEHYEMDIDYQDGNSNDKAETLRIDKTNKGKIYIA